MAPSGIAVAARTEAAEALKRAREGDGLDSGELRALALEFNPELRRLRAEVGVADGNARQAGVLPNPEFEAGQYDILTGGGEGRGRTEFALSQPLPVGGRRARGVEAARMRAEVARCELHATEARVAREVEAGVVEVLYQLESETLAREVLEMVEADHELAQESDLHGELSEREAARAGLHVGELDLDVTKATAERIFALLRLRRLVGSTEVLPGDVRGELLSAMPRGALAVPTREAIAAHPETALALARIRAAEAAVALARAEGIPDVTVRAAGGYDARMDEGYAGGGISIPVPVFDRKQGAVDSARAALAAAGEAASGTGLDLEVRLDEVLQRVTEYDTLASVGVDVLLPEARAAHARVRADYAAGRATFLDLMDAQRTFVDVAYRTLEYRRQLHLYVVELGYLKAGIAGEATTPRAGR